MVFNDANWSFVKTKCAGACAIPAGHHRAVVAAAIAMSKLLVMNFMTFLPEIAGFDPIRPRLPLKLILAARHVNRRRAGVVQVDRHCGCFRTLMLGRDRPGVGLCAG